MLRPSWFVRQWASEVWLAQGNAIEAGVSVEEVEPPEYFDGKKLPVRLEGVRRPWSPRITGYLQAVTIIGKIAGHDADIINPGWTRHRATPMTFEMLQAEVSVGAG